MVETAQPRPAVRPPRQKRSRRTREALLDAAERLLRERPWESISIVEIMREAGCSNGAIYGRFQGKDDLLVALYERHDARLRERFESTQPDAPRTGQTLEDYLRAQIDQLIRTMRENRWLLRAVGLLSRTKPELVSGTKRRERRDMFEQIGARFLHFAPEMAHEDPERGVQLAVFFVATMVREAILYQGPHAQTLELSDRELKESLTRMALGFLGVERRTK